MDVEQTLPLDKHLLNPKFQLHTNGEDFDERAQQEERNKIIKMEDEGEINATISKSQKEIEDLKKLKM